MAQIFPVFISYNLQRKNGLFKKAYELGVLCSVDVTVIIFGAFHCSSFPHISSHLQFPDKAGSHSEKLYEYCSTGGPDVQASKRLEVSALVQRIRWH